MSFYKEYPFTTVFGVRYLLIFTEFSDSTDFNFPVIDISLVCEDDIEQANDIDVLITVNRFIKKYLTDHKDAILYYYCDTAPIIRSSKNEHLSNQEYRQILFDRMFELARFKNAIKKSIVITDLEEGNHFINLISHSNMASAIEELASNVEDLKK